MNAVLAIAGTELRIGFRNRWILLSSLILLVFALLLVLLGSAPSGETTVSPLTVVAASLSTLSVYLVPLIALLLSFDAIAGEIDRGTLQLGHSGAFGLGAQDQTRTDKPPVQGDAARAAIAGAAALFCARQPKPVAQHVQ